MEENITNTDKPVSLRKPSHFITKFLCTYILIIIINYIRAFIDGSFNNGLDAFSLFAYSSAHIFYLHFMWSVFLAIIWTHLEKNEPATKIVKFRNIFIADFFVSVCCHLMGYINGAEQKNLLDFYIYTFLESWVIYLFEPFAQEWLKKNSVNIVNIIEKIYIFIVYWALIVILLSWTPFMDNLVFMTMPVVAISAPIELFVGNHCDVAVTIVILYFLKQFIVKQLISINDIQEDQTSGD